MANQEAWRNVLRYLDNVRPTFMDRGNKKGVPRGWVIDGEQADAPWWNTIQGNVIPLRPKSGFLGLKPKEGKQAERHLQDAEKRLGGKVTVLMVPDGESESGWFARPVRTDTPGRTRRDAFAAAYWPCRPRR